MFTVNMHKPKILKQMNQNYLDWKANAQSSKAKWDLFLNVHDSYLISPLDFKK